MKKHGFTVVIAVELGLILAATPALSQTRPPTEGPAVDGSPAWFLQGSFPDPGGRTVVLQRAPAGKPQLFKFDKDYNLTGKVLGAIGNGMGIGMGQFIEASYWVMDRHHNLYAGDTSVGRITRMVAPGQK